MQAGPSARSGLVAPPSSVTRDRTHPHASDPVPARRARDAVRRRPGVFVAPHGRLPGSLRYLSSHEDGETHTARVFGLLARRGRPEVPGAWDLHHLVDPAHLAEIDFRGEFAAHHQPTRCPACCSTIPSGARSSASCTGRRRTPRSPR